MSSSIRSRVDSIEKIRLLGELAHEDSSRLGGDVYSFNWVADIQNGQGVPGSVRAVLEEVSRSPCQKKKEVFVQNKEIVEEMIQCISSGSNPQGQRMIVEAMADVGRCDASLWDHFIMNFPELTYLLLKLFLQSDVSDLRVNGAVAFCLSSLINRSNNVSEFLNPFLDQLFVLLTRQSISSTAALASVCNLLKLDEVRTSVAGDDRFTPFLIKSLCTVKDQVLIYWAVFAIWLLSFNNDAAMKCMEPNNVLEVFCDSLQKIKREKIVRVACMAMQNLLQYDWAIEVFGTKRMNHTIALWEYEKWRDDEFYAEIRDLNGKLHVKLSTLSNFERYKRELDSGRLKWSPLHTEKFWIENFQQFEVNEFKPIKQLHSLLKSSDPTTLAVACFDLGEFACLHPLGKQILTKFKTKNTVMELMSHSNRDVSRQSLLCYQKMMLGNWRDVRKEKTDSR